MEFMLRYGGLFRWAFRGAIFTLIMLAVVAYCVFDHTDYALNLLTEMIGVVLSICVTVFIVDRLYAHRERESLRRRLIREVGSGSNPHALNAASWLRAEGWLGGKVGALKNADLRGADLRNVSLWYQNHEDGSEQLADLEGAILWGSNLSDAVLIKANLQTAELRHSNLERAYLDDANLQGALLNAANLKEARLYGANMQGAIMIGAKHLNKACLSGAILPDGRRFEHGMSLSSYVNPNDPNFKETESRINEIRKCMGLFPHTVVMEDALTRSNEIS